MNFNNKQITDAGNALLAHSIAENKATIIDTLIVSNTTSFFNTNLNTIVESNFTNALTFKTYGSRVNGNTVEPQTVISNQGLTSDYPINLVGAIAHTDGENNQTVFAVAVGDANDPFNIPAQTSIAYQLYFNMGITFANASDAQNVQVTVSNAGLVTQSTLAAAASMADSNAQIYASVVNSNAQSLATSNSTYISNVEADKTKKEYSTSHNSDVNSLASLIASNANGITSNGLYVSNVEADKDKKEYITSHNADVNSLESQIISNASGVASNGLYIKNVESDKNNKEYISSHNADINSLSSAVASNANGIASNGLYISNVEADKDKKEYIASHNSDVNSLAALIASNSSGVTSNGVAISSVAASLGTWNRSGFDSVGGSVAWLYTQNNQRIADITSNSSAIGSVAASLGDWNRSGFDSLGGSVSWLMAQNNSRNSDISSVSSLIASNASGISSNSNYISNVEADKDKKEYSTSHSADVAALQTQINVLNNANQTLINSMLKNWHIETKYLTNHYPDSTPDMWLNPNSNTFYLKGTLQVTNGDWIVIENPNIADYMSAKGYTSFYIAGSWLNNQQVSDLMVFIRGTMDNNNTQNGVIQFKAYTTGELQLDGVAITLGFK